MSEETLHWGCAQEPKAQSQSSSKNAAYLATLQMPPTDHRPTHNIFAEKSKHWAEQALRRAQAAIDPSQGLDEPTPSFALISQDRIEGAGKGRQRTANQHSAPLCSIAAKETGQ